MLVYMISYIQIQMFIRLSTAKSINTYLKAKIYPHTTRILNFRYEFNDFVPPNYIWNIYSIFYKKKKKISNDKGFAIT